MIHSTDSILRGTLLLLPALVLLACTSSPPKPTVDHKSDYNFSKVSKIALYTPDRQVQGDNPLQLSDIQRERINSALTYALRNKGFEIVEDPRQADLLLSWHLITQHKTDVRTYQSPSYGVGYAGYRGYNRYSAYNCWNCSPTRTEVSVQNYTQGTFIVDMIDPGMGKSVWRGVTQSRLKGKHSEDQGKYNEAATVIFATFPP